MHIYAVNASPRKNRNTATLLQHALNGALEAAGPEAEATMLHLADYDFGGCRSCFECKRLGGKSYGRCAVRDGITPVLDLLSQADAVVFGSPIYFGSVTAKMRALEERLLFPYYVYAENGPFLAPRPVRTAFIYTMNVTEETMRAWGYPEHLGLIERYMGRIFGGRPESLYACYTYQFDDYSKYKCDKFPEAEKRRRREEQFPVDCRKAREMGARLTASGDNP